MAEPKPQGVSLVSPDGRLKVEFHWHQDRFAQTLFLDGVEAGASIEGDAENPWPPSPPLQQLSRQQIDGRDVVLGVGAAGRGHWSISVELAQEAGTCWLKFDVACRSKDSPSFLGSTYRLSDSMVMTPSSPNARLQVRRNSSRDARTSICLDIEADRTHCWSFSLGPKISQKT